MSAADRKNLEGLISRLRDAQSTVEAIGEEIRAMGEAEQEKFDNMPESLQEGEQGQKIAAAAEALEWLADFCAGGDIEAAIDELESAEGVTA